MSTISTEAKPKQIATNLVRAGKRTYFFDLNAGPRGGLYLAVSETAVQEEGVFTRNRLLVAETHIREFYEGLCEAIRAMREEQKKRETADAAVEAPAEAKPAARKKKAA